MSRRVIIMEDMTHVPDKLEGYLLQTRHALFDLISFDADRIVSVEAYDDVAIETSRSVIAEQLKSVLSDNNPLANHAIAFWKAIYNWSIYLTMDSFHGKEARLKFVVSSKQNLAAGSIAKEFNAATNIRQAKKALEKAKLIIWGASDSPKMVAKGLEKYINHCFNEDNEAIVLSVIQKFTIELHNGDYDEKLQERFSNQAIPSEYSHDLFIYMLGWVNEQIHNQIKKNVPAYISSSDYLCELRAQCRRRDRNRILSAISMLPEEKDTFEEISRRATYIRQIELIDGEYTDLLQAACDFIRSRTEKTEWAKRGLVTVNDMEDYDDSLIRIWKLNKRVAQMSYSDEKQAGLMTYLSCMKDAKNERLQGCDVPPFFGAGCLHELADKPSNNPQIGWHPNYTKLLKEGERNER